jgi:hypothetical protein
LTQFEFHDSLICLFNFHFSKLFFMLFSLIYLHSIYCKILIFCFRIYLILNFELIIHKQEFNQSSVWTYLDVWGKPWLTSFKCYGNFTPRRIGFTLRHLLSRRNYVKIINEIHRIIVYQTKVIEPSYYPRYWDFSNIAKMPYIIMDIINLRF